jgi:hypothetical protein
VPLHWIMSYDVKPLVTLESKRVLFARAMQENWLPLFEPDASVPWGQLAHGGKGYALAQE